MNVTLSVLIGHEVEKSYEFSLPGLYVIGRHPGSAIRLYDGKCSRRHALLIVGCNTVRLRELGSANGTQVDGITVGGGCPPGAGLEPEDEATVKEPQNFPEDITTVHDVILRDCTIIAIGNTRIRVMMDEDALTGGGLLSAETLEGRPVVPNPGPLKAVGVGAKLDFTPVGATGSGERSVSCDLTELGRKHAAVSVRPEDLEGFYEIVRAGEKRGVSLYLSVLESRRVLPLRGQMTAPARPAGDSEAVGIQIEITQSPAGVASIFANLFG